MFRPAIVAALLLLTVSRPRRPSPRHRDRRGRGARARRSVRRRPRQGRLRGATALFTADANQLVSSGEWRRGRDAVVKGSLASSQQTQGTRTSPSTRCG